MGTPESVQLLLPTRELMTANPERTSPDALAIAALRQMEDKQPTPIYLLPVADEDGRPVGLLHVHTLVQAGLTSDDAKDA